MDAIDVEGGEAGDVQAMELARASLAFLDVALDLYVLPAGDAVDAIDVEGLALLAAVDRRRGGGARRRGGAAGPSRRWSSPPVLFLDVALDLDVLGAVEAVHAIDVEAIAVEAVEL